MPPLAADYIPYPLRTQITQIDPKLDIFWQQRLHEIFTQISPQERKNIAEQLLAPNNIFWNGKSKIFEYREAINLSFGQICANIPSRFKNLRVIANKIQASLVHLDSYRDALQIADYIENMLGKITEFDVDDDLEQQVQKQRLFRAFIYTVGDIIRRKQELTLPDNARRLDSNAVKVFINEVYLKHQLLGYWFKTLRQRQLQEFDHPLISGYLADAQKSRQLEIVRASGYIFVIAPMLEYAANPFTIRRFLLEDYLFGRTLLLNGVALPTDALPRTTPAYEEAFKRQISCIITVEGNVRRAVMDFIEQLNLYHEDNLLPLLFTPFEVSAEGLEKAVESRLKQYEQRLCFGILKPMAQALRRLPTSPEEFDYLYVTMRQLMGAVISAFKDFQTQPALLMNQASDVLLGRLVAYAVFLEKRRGDVFVEMDDIQWKENHKNTRLLPNHAQQVAKEYIQDFLTQQRAVKAQESLVEQPASFIQKLLKTKEKQIDDLERMKKDLRKLQYDAHAKLFHLPDNVKAHTVHMEFDTQLITDDTMRHYAFPDGDNGISALPITFSLPENRMQFDLVAFAQQVGAINEEDLPYSEESLAAAEKVLLKRS